MAQVTVINVSAPYDNLGAWKLRDWLRTHGHAVAYHDGDPGLFGGRPDQVGLSVIFSWHAPLAAELAWRYTPHADVCCGGLACSRWGTGGSSRRVFPVTAAWTGALSVSGDGIG